jgi:membrane glycosyltransferase
MTLSAFLELVLSTLLAPNLAWLQSHFVLSILMGSTAKWEVQDRGDSGTTWREAITRHWPSTAFGIGWTCLLALTAPALLGWFSPVLIGLLLGTPLSVWTSKASVGLWTRSHKLFVIPEESAPPQILKDFEEASRQNETRLWCEPGDPLARVLANAEVRELHLAMLPKPSTEDDPLKAHHREGLVLKLQHYGSDALSRQEKRELLLHADAIQALSPPGANQ